MHKSRFLIVIVCFLTLLYSVVSAGMNSYRLTRKYRCINVIDGDTVVLERGGRFIKVRLANIDAPESKQLAYSGEPIGKWAQMYLQSLILNRNVIFSMESKDIYGRYVGTLVHNGININLKMVREGFAIPYHFATNDFYRISHSQAFINRRGIWKTEGMLNPRLYRNTKKFKKLYTEIK